MLRFILFCLVCQASVFAESVNLDCRTRDVHSLLWEFGIESIESLPASQFLKAKAKSGVQRNKGIVRVILVSKEYGTFDLLGFEKDLTHLLQKKSDSISLLLHYELKEGIPGDRPDVSRTDTVAVACERSKS